jgi:hypothetical protein
MTSTPLPTRRDAIVVCVTVGLTIVACAALCLAAFVVPAPPVVVPFVVVVSIAVPMVAAWDLPMAIAVLRSPSSALARRNEAATAVALNKLRAELAELPETQHPLGL